MNSSPVALSNVTAVRSLTFITSLSWERCKTLRELSGTLFFLYSPLLLRTNRFGEWSHIGRSCLGFYTGDPIAKPGIKILKTRFCTHIQKMIEGMAFWRQFIVPTDFPIIEHAQVILILKIFPLAKTKNFIAIHPCNEMIRKSILFQMLCKPRECLPHRQPAQLVFLPSWMTQYP